MARTRANINNIALAIRSDLELLNRLNAGGNYRNDVMGSLSTNMKVFANALDEERGGRTDFVGGLPSICIERILGD